LKFQIKYDKLLARSHTLDQKLSQIHEKNMQLSEENFSLNYMLQNEKNKNQESTKKINILENRLDIISSKQEKSIEMKNCLQDLIKENDSLKRVIANKSNEIEKSNDNNVKLQKKTLQLNKKITALKIQKFTNSSQILDNETEKIELNFRQFGFFLENNLPITLDWRINSLKPEFSSKISRNSIFKKI